MWVPVGVKTQARLFSSGDFFSLSLIFPLFFSSLFAKILKERKSQLYPSPCKIFLSSSCLEREREEEAFASKERFVFFLLLILSWFKHHFQYPFRHLHPSTQKLRAGHKDVNFQRVNPCLSFSLPSFSLSLSTFSPDNSHPIHFINWLLFPIKHFVKCHPHPEGEEGKDEKEDSLRRRRNYFERRRREEEEVNTGTKVMDGEVLITRSFIINRR